MDLNGGYLMKFLNITSLILGALVVGNSIVAAPPSKPLPIFQANKTQQAPRSWFDYAFSRPNVQRAAQEIVNTQQETASQETVPQETVSQETVPQGTVSQGTAEATNSTETQEELAIESGTYAKKILLGVVVPALLYQNSYTYIAYYPYLCWRYGLRGATGMFIVNAIKSLARTVNCAPTSLVSTMIVDTALFAFIAKPWINSLLGAEQIEPQSAQPNSEEQSTQPTNV
jgi:sarcosine oxidase delta subunit